jgi:hypothetical protein
LKNNEAIFELNQVMESTRTELNKTIETYGLSSNEVVIASQNLDTYINMIIKIEV